MKQRWIETVIRVELPHDWQAVLHKLANKVVVWGRINSLDRQIPHTPSFRKPTYNNQKRKKKTKTWGWQDTNSHWLFTRNLDLGFSFFGFALDGFLDTGICNNQIVAWYRIFTTHPFILLATCLKRKMICNTGVCFLYKLAWGKSFKLRERYAFAPAQLSNQIYQFRQIYWLNRDSKPEPISYKKSSFCWLYKKWWPLTVLHVRVHQCKLFQRQTRDNLKQSLFFQHWGNVSWNRLTYSISATEYISSIVKHVSGVNPVESVMINGSIWANQEKRCTLFRS